MDEAPEELRLVEVDHGIRAAWRDDIPRWSLRGPLMVLAAVWGAFFLGLTLEGLIGKEAAGGVAIALCLTIVGVLLVGTRVPYHHIVVQSHGITMDRLKLRHLRMPLQPSVEDLLDHTATTVAHLPFVDIADMGVRDDHIWFRNDVGRRIEIRLDAFGHRDVQRLYDHIAPLWRAQRRSAAPMAHAERARQDVARLTNR